MAKCTGKRCPMQVGYKVDECDYKDCQYRTEPITNADRIRSMTDEELADLIVVRVKDIHHQGMRELAYSAWLEWLQKPAENTKEDTT